MTATLEPIAFMDFIAEGVFMEKPPGGARLVPTVLQGPMSGLLVLERELEGECCARVVWQCLHEGHDYDEAQRCAEEAMRQVWGG